MRCKACGKRIKFEHWRWHHYHKQNHYAVPNYSMYYVVMLSFLMFGIGYYFRVGFCT